MLYPMDYSFVSDIRYGVMMPGRPAIRMTTRRDQTERWKADLRWLQTRRLYQNRSLAFKVRVKRVYAAQEVPVV